MGAKVLPMLLVRAINENVQAFDDLNFETEGRGAAEICI